MTLDFYAWGQNQAMDLFGVHKHHNSQDWDSFDATGPSVDRSLMQGIWHMQTLIIHEVW